MGNLWVSGATPGPKDPALLTWHSLPKGDAWATEALMGCKGNPAASHLYAILGARFLACKTQTKGNTGHVSKGNILMMLRMLRWYPACFGYLGNTIEISGPTFSPFFTSWGRHDGSELSDIRRDSRPGKCCKCHVPILLLVDSMALSWIVHPLKLLKDLKGYLQMSRCRLLTLFAVYGSAETRTQRTSRRSVSSRQDPILTQQWQKKKN